jgi:replicative DNA helicase
MHHAQLLFSKVIDANDVAVLTRYGITAKDLPTEGDRQVFKFVTEYADKNRGQAPSYAEVTAQCPEFIYSPQVGDSYEYLAREIKKHSAKMQFAELVNSKLGEQFENVGQKDIFKLFKWLQSEVESIKMGTSVRDSIGRTLDEIKVSVKDEYLKREAGKSAKRWDTPFESLTAEISGWFSGDIYGVIGESGRGKSYLMAKIIDSLLRQGANVLWKSYEVKEFISIARLVSIATAVDELLLDELGRKVGIPNRQILTGKLDEVVRDHFLTVLETLDSYYPGTLYFQGKSGAELTRTLSDLERELATGMVDAVVLDPFYGLADVYGKNVNKTSGGAAEFAATRFENIIGDYDVVGFYTVQATVEKKQTNEEGVRELRVPTRDKVKTTARLLDIATNLIGFDSVAKEGIAGLGIEKGRNGGEDFFLELMALFDYGVLKEFPTGEAGVSQFNF